MLRRDLCRRAPRHLAAHPKTFEHDHPPLGFAQPQRAGEADDPRTDVILLYLESFGNPKKFGQIARRVGRRKPIVAVKAGRSTAGARAASSHTGARATSDALVDTLLRQAGVIRTHTLEELFDVASLLAHQPVPLGRNVAILVEVADDGPGSPGEDHEEQADREADEAPDDHQQLGALHPAMIQRCTARRTAPIRTNSMRV